MALGPGIPPQTGCTREHIPTSSHLPLRTLTRPPPCAGRS